MFIITLLDSGFDSTDGDKMTDDSDYDYNARLLWQKHE